MYETVHFLRILESFSGLREYIPMHNLYLQRFTSNFFLFWLCYPSYLGIGFIGDDHEALTRPILMHRLLVYTLLL